MTGKVSLETVPNEPLDWAARFAGAAHFFKGRVALYAILKTLGVGPGDAVVVPGYTCVVVPAAVYFAGARPLYADIDPATYNAALPHFAMAVESHPVKAIVVQHTYGIPADIAPIIRWAQPRGIWVIEDCCHALGSRYRDVHASRSASWREVGRLGDAAFFSSQWSKPFTTGVGGWATAADADLQRRLNEFARTECIAPSMAETAALALQLGLYKLAFRPRLFWLAQDAQRLLTRLGLFVGSSQRGELDLEMPRDYAKRIWRLAPAAARKALKQAAKHIEHRRRLKAFYDEALQAEGFTPLAVPPYADPVLLRYPLRVPNKPGLLALARRHHVELGDWFDHPLHPAGAEVARLGWHEGLCPAAERAAAEVVNLPLHRRVSPRQAERVVRFLTRHGH